MSTSNPWACSHPDCETEMGLTKTPLGSFCGVHLQSGIPRESSSLEAYHQRNLVESLQTIMKIAREQYAMDQNSSAWVQVADIAEKAIKENQ